MNPPETSLHDLELKIVRETDVPREKLCAGWTKPEFYPEWFCPKPWYVSDVKIDLRVGGECSMFMNGPNGEKFPNRGVFLEVIPNEKIVFTDAYFAGWVPNPDHFMTAIVTYETLPNGKTRYTAYARHWSAEAKQKHEAMGFVDGWNKAFDQLVELMSAK